MLEVDAVRPESSECTDGFPGQVIVQGFGQRQIPRPGNVSGSRINGFGFTPKSHRVAGIEEVETGDTCNIGRKFACRQDPVIARAGRETAGHRALIATPDRVAAAQPLVQAAVEHADRLVAEPPQHPPCTSSVCPAVLVVDDDIAAGVHTEFPEAASCIVGGRQRVPTAGRRDRGGQVLVEIDVDRARYMPDPVRPPSGIGIAEIGTAIEQADVSAGSTVPKRVRIDQVTMSHACADRSITITDLVHTGVVVDNTRRHARADE